MSATTRRPVVIIGAGPVGVTAALLLARYGVPSLLLERHRDIYPLPRAVVVDDEVRRILQNVGVHEEFAAMARPAPGLRLLDARHRVIGEFPRSMHGLHGFPQLSMFNQPELERLLRSALARRPECELWSEVEVVSITRSDPPNTGTPDEPAGSVRVTFRRHGSDEDEHLWADAVLGCDEVIRQAQYTFQARLADRWRRGRVFLLGDAAHLTPPFVGQGLCSGLRDANNLTWKLARVLRQGSPEELLDTYERERKPHARHVIRMAVAVGWAMTGGQGRGAALRRAVVGTVCRIPGVTEVVSRDLSPVLAAGPLVRRRPRPAGRAVAGAFCPQPWIRHDGRRVRLDDVVRDAFVVLTAIPATAQMTAVTRPLGAPTIHVEDLDDDGTLAAWLARGRVDAVLLRPDRVVMDTVPAGSGHFTDPTAWASLLHTARPPTDARSLSLPRSTTP
ncbi:FAD-dependent monooxygenase [Streptomyces nigra]|uniref:FAD-dependent monooxygenase n=1 Tax=Streptomyces nigra TaxID=1827580 RepID=UPI00368F068C